MSEEGKSGAVPAVTLGGCDNALSVARSLGRRGIPVYALGRSELRYSRFVTEMPRSAGSTQESWRRWLLGEGLERCRGGVVFPCNDEAVELVARHRSELEPHYRLLDGEPELALAMLDKGTTYARARAAGVPTPRVWSINSRETLLEQLPEIPYPCALKPRHGHRFRRHFGSVKLFVVENEAELLSRFGDSLDAGLEMLVTEIIPGDDDQYCSYSTYITASGEPLYHFTKRKPRQYPIHFGLGTFHVTEWLPDVAEMGLRFCLGAGLRGPGVVEFKRDPRDGSLKLIECNARLVATNEILERSGIDLSLLLYNHLTGKPLPPRDSYRSDVRLWFPFQDWKALGGYRKTGELTLRTWLKSLLPLPYVSLFRWSDPLPVFAAVGTVVAAGVARSVRRAAAKFGERASAAAERKRVAFGGDP